MGAPTGVLLYEGVTWADVHSERFLGGWGGVCDAEDGSEGHRTG